MPKLSYVAGNGERFLYIHGPKPEYEADDDPHDWNYIPCRALPLLRRGKDIAVLPDNRAVRDFAHFCERLLGLEEWQILFVSGDEYLIEKRAMRVVDQLRDVVALGEWVCMPYCVTGDLQRVVESIRGDVRIFGDDRSWIERFGSKAILHPNAFPDRRDENIPLIEGVRVAKGFVAESGEELVRAYSLLRDQGVSRVILKPTTSATGEGIVKDATPELFRRYRFPLGAVVLEECLDIDRDGNGDVAPSIQFCGNCIGEPTDQVLDGFAYAGNQGPCSVSAEFQRKFRSLTLRLVEWMQPKGPGGLDVLSVKGEPVLVDINVGRWTGAHPIQFFRSLYAGDAAFSCRKVLPQRPVADFWDDLVRRGLAFVPGESAAGIFPLCYLTGMWGMLAAFAPTRDEASTLLSQAIALA